MTAGKRKEKDVQSNVESAGAEKEKEVGRVGRRVLEGRLWGGIADVCIIFKDGGGRREKERAQARP